MRNKTLTSAIGGLLALALAAPAIAQPKDPRDDDLEMPEFTAGMAANSPQTLREFRIVYHALAWANADLQVRGIPPLFCHKSQLTPAESLKLLQDYLAESPWTATQPVPVAIPLISALRAKYPCPPR